MCKIHYLHARQILDSRGTPTVEVDMSLVQPETKEELSFVTASVPSGTSTGLHEAVELRDNKINKFNGKGVEKAVENINSLIWDSVQDKDFVSLEDFDSFLIELDGTENKSRMGANAILACSIAYLKCLAKLNNKPLFKFLNPNPPYLLPSPLMNIINGGAHANNGLDIQEFMIVPAGFDSFSDSLRAGVETFMNLKKILEKNGYSTAVGDEGGFAPNLKSNEEALELISEAIKQADYELGGNIYLALDVAASEIYKDGKYEIDKKLLNTEEIIQYYEKIISNYPIISIEDPLHEDDWNAWTNLTKKLGNKVQIVGDDLFVTSKKRLKLGIENEAGNSILIKINQIGTISETLKTIELARQNNYSYIISHRSGETEDTTIADIAVATGAGQIKTGSCSRTDRVAKYNQLLRIEELLGEEEKKFAKLSTFQRNF